MALLNNFIQTFYTENFSIKNFFMQIGCYMQEVQQRALVRKLITFHTLSTNELSSSTYWANVIKMVLLRNLTFCTLLLSTYNYFYLLYLYVPTWYFVVQEEEKKHHRLFIWTLEPKLRYKYSPSGLQDYRALMS